MGLENEGNGFQTEIIVAGISGKAGMTWIALCLLICA
jgi:hypothetical protein